MIKILKKIKAYTIWGNSLAYTMEDGLYQLIDGAAEKIIDYPNSLIFRYGDYLKLSKYNYGFHLLIDESYNAIKYTNPHYRGYDRLYIYI